MNPVALGAGAFAAALSVVAFVLHLSYKRQGEQKSREEEKKVKEQTTAHEFIAPSTTITLNVYPDGAATLTGSDIVPAPRDMEPLDFVGNDETT